MYLQKKFLCPFFLLILFFTMGCAGSKSLGSIPSKHEDFMLTADELKARFPEVISYSKGNTTVKDIFTRCTPVEEIITLWGEPDEKENDWRFHGLASCGIALGGIAGGGISGAAQGLAIILGMVPLPSQKYTWHKGDYKITGKVDTVIWCGYKKCLVYWEWSETIK